MAAQRLGKRVLSKLQSPSRARGPGGSPGGLQKRHARVTVKYDRRELQRRLDVEKWIDGRLEELYRGRVRQGGVWRRSGGGRRQTPGLHTLRPSGLRLLGLASVTQENALPGTRHSGDSLTLLSLLRGTSLWAQTHTCASRDVSRHLLKAGD